MANNHGGARPGAGRKTNAEKYAPQIAALTSMCAEHLRPAFWRLWDLVQGGERVEIEEVPSRLVTRRDVARDADGEVIRDDKGKPTVVDARCYPDLDPDALVVVKRRTATLQPEIRAIQELLSRAMGQPFRSEDAAVDPDDALNVGPADLANLSGEDLDALEKIASRLAGGQPPGDPAGGPDRA